MGTRSRPGRPDFGPAVGTDDRNFDLTKLAFRPARTIISPGASQLGGVASCAPRHPSRPMDRSKTPTSCWMILATGRAEPATDENAADREPVIRDSQASSAARCAFFNSAAGWCRDVTADLADEAGPTLSRNRRDAEIGSRILGCKQWGLKQVKMEKLILTTAILLCGVPNARARDAAFEAADVMFYDKNCAKL
jgi:hypothetical protein